MEQFSEHFDWTALFLSSLTLSKTGATAREKSTDRRIFATQHRCLPLQPGTYGFRASDTDKFKSAVNAEGSGSISPSVNCMETFEGRSSSACVTRARLILRSYATNTHCSQRMSLRLRGARWCRVRSSMFSLIKSWMTKRGACVNDLMTCTLAAANAPRASVRTTQLSVLGH